MAWLLFLIIVLIALLNFLVTKRIASREAASELHSHDRTDRREGRPGSSPPRTRAARRSGGGHGGARRPASSPTASWVPSCWHLFPLYWSFLVGSHDNTVLSRGIPLLPGGNFLANAAKVFDSIPFWKAMGNSLIVSCVTAASVVVFSTLAGFAAQAPLPPAARGCWCSSSQPWRFPPSWAWSRCSS